MRNQLQGRRCPAVSLQDVLGRESQHQAVPPVLLEQSTPDLGLDDLPRERYFDQGIHDLEIDKVWRKVWQVACREDDIPAVGDCHVYEIGSDSMIVVRLSPTEIRGYWNACLHRGTQLVREACNLPNFRCPFHGWTWNLEGSLRSLPCGWDFPQVEAAELRLPQVKVATWDGWVFVNLDPDAGALEDYLENLPELMAPWPMRDRFKAVHVATRIACNWKVLLEAFLESYHVWVTHPQLAPYSADANTQYDVWGDHVTRMITMAGLTSPNLRTDWTDQDIATAFVRDFQLGDESAVSVPEGTTARDYLSELLQSRFGAMYGLDLSGVAAAEFDAIQYLLFPNLIIFAGYGFPIVYRYRPDGNDAESSIADIMLLLPLPPGSAKPPAAPVHWIDAADFREASELGALAAVFNQDMENLPRVQKGLRTTRKPGVTLGAYQESRIRHHARTLDDYLAR